MKTELERYKKAYSVLLEELRKHGTGLDSPDTVGEAIIAAQELLNPPPEMETVEVVRWECAECGEVYRGYTGSYCGKELPSGKECQCVERIKLTGTYQKEKPQPVVREVSVPAYIDSLGKVQAGDRDGRTAFWYEPDCHGKTGTLIFRWEE